MRQADDIFFNELSLQTLGASDKTQQLVVLYSEVVRKCGELGHTKVRYEYEFSALMIADNESLSDYCYKNFRNPELNTAINLILTTQKHPYIDDDSNQEKRYVEHEYQVVIDQNPCFGYGLSSAFIDGSFAIGFHTDPKWDSFCFDMMVDQDYNGQVFCVSQLEHFESPAFIDWYVATYDVAYTTPTEKGAIHLRADHGKNVLQEFAEKILKEDFVIEVINSLPFAPKASDFIEKVTEDGVIYIRLTNSDRGLGLAVRTVGKNRIQTSYFAKTLREKYGC